MFIKKKDIILYCLKNVPDETPNNNQAGQVIIICEDNEEYINMNNNEDIEQFNDDINFIDEWLFE